VTWQLSITGLLIGALVGLTGMGGGSLLTPMLILFFGFQPTLAVGTDILHGAVFKSFGAVRHRRLGTVHARITFWMILGSAPMSLLGVEVANWIENQYGSGVGDAMAKMIGAALILGGLGFLAKTAVERPRGRGSLGLGNHGRRVVAPLPAGALGEVGERRPLENLDRRVAHLAPGSAQRVGDELRRRVRIAPRRVADRRELALEEPHDALKRDLLRRLVQPVPTGRPALGAHDPGGAHHRHHLFQDGLGSPRSARELLELHRLVTVEGERE
jgi:Sulfite exporter TauE/SafE